MPGQPSDVCGVDDTYHEGALTRIVVALQPTAGADLPWRFTQPIWEEEISVCAYHMYPLAFPAVACPEGLVMRLVWDGEIVE